MNYLDAVLVAVTLLCIYAGYKGGFISTGAILLRLVTPFFTGVFLYKPVAVIISGLFTIRPEWEYAAAFFMVYLIAFVTISLTLKAVIAHLPPAAINSGVNKKSGIVPGFLLGLVASLILSKALFFSQWTAAAFQAKNGFISGSLAEASGWVDRHTQAIFNRPVNEKLAGDSSHETIANPVQTNIFTVRPGLETQMLALVNEERQKFGLQPLAADHQLKKLARGHAADMLMRGYFSHNTPEGKTPFDRMKAAGITYTAAGENLAGSASLQRAHTGLMNSPGHRENILNPAFGRIGIGVQDGGDKGLMIAQEFMN